jgi:hypothetical protein
MRGDRGFRRALIVAVSCLGLMVPVTAAGMSSASAAVADAPAASLGSAWQGPQSPPSGQNMALLGTGDSGAVQEAEAAAVQAARKTGTAQVVAAATTQTSLVTAEPDGVLEASQNVLPVRVRRGSGWAAVSTSLVRAAGGRLAAAAVPGDTVSFSGGGTGPAAEMTDSGSGLSVWWPGTLPAPAVSGASATYRNVLPGVNLVLTATSTATGGFSSSLVITSRTAARDPGLARLALRVSAPGTAGLRSVAGGGVAAVMKGGRGSFAAPAPVMWDSSVVRPDASGAVVRAAARAARTAGAGLAGAGYGPVSTAAAPAGGALVAGVRTAVSAGGTELSLVPDQKMLTSPSVRFPVFIDPSFQTENGTGTEQAYDPVQSDAGNSGVCNGSVCDTTDCRSSHYNDSSYSQGLPVGYDNFEDGPCEFNDTDYALYRVGIPSGPFASQAVLIDASFKADEVYSSDCSSTATMTASWIGGIGSGTGWPGPGLSSGNSNATASAGPDSGSCDTTEDTSSTVGVGFNITADLNNMSGSPGSITLRLWENGNTNQDDHRQFADNPTLQVMWTDTPDVPGNLSESATSSGTGTLDCDTSSANPPRIGKTDSISGLDLTAKYGDPDGAAVQANIEYENLTAKSAWTTKDDVIGSVDNASESWELPSSVLSGLADGTVIGWRAQAETGSASVDGKTFGPYSSAWSPTCFFAVYPDAPDAPVVSAGFTQADAQPVGSSLSFTIIQSGSDTASEFVWGLDEVPPTTGTIPAAQTCSATSTTCKLTVTGGLATATLTVTVPSPGPHDLNVYAEDASGNISATTDGAPGSGTTWTFSGAADTPASFTSKTLQENFAAARDNIMISTEAGSPGSADADGIGNALDSAELESAGWKPGQTVTVDGATFPLPQFGSTADTADNVLAAGQTIGAGTGVQGSALVFLATSTDGFVQVPGNVGTGSPDAGALDSDTTAPYTPVGYGVTGDGCSAILAINTTATCTPATGNIFYSGTGCPVTSTSYTLAVPDWVSGPSDIAALQMTSRDHPGGQQADTPAVYAFAVPLNPSCTVTSVQLPDVGDSVTATVASGVTESVPALHILGMTVRNTTTATPTAGTIPDGGPGTTAPPASPSGQAWTGVFESPVEDAFSPPSGDTWGDQTMRIALSQNTVIPAGTDIRIRLSDPGFLSGDGTGPLTIGAATIAPQASAGGPVPATTPTALSFGSPGSPSVTVPVGGDVYSNPVSLSSPVTTRLLVSLLLTNPSIPELPANSFPSGARAWFAPSSTPDETGDTTGTPFSTDGYVVNAVPLLTGVDVATPGVPINLTPYPGAPTVVVAGDNVIDGPDASAQADVVQTPSQRLAGQLYSQGVAGQLYNTAGTPAYGAVDAGVQSNSVLKDGDTSGTGVPGGPSLLARIDRDILAEPDVGTVVIDEGLQDLLSDDGSPTDTGDLLHAISLIQQQLEAFGVGQVIFGTITPCGSFSDSVTGLQCDASVEMARLSVNENADDVAGICQVDFAAAVTASGVVTTSGGVSIADLIGTDNAGDHANLTLGTGGGYAALAQAVSMGQCPLAPPAAAPPPA